jgi:hypothetical protein
MSWLKGTFSLFAAREWQCNVKIIFTLFVAWIWIRMRLQHGILCDLLELLFAFWYQIPCRHAWLKYAYWTCLVYESSKFA